MTCDIDDSLYVSLDEATKMADVEVVYAHSFYAGSAHASGPLSGEIIGILAGPSPAEARAGLAACVDYARNEAWFHAADEAGDLAFFAHPISRTGSYLSKEADVAQGTSMAYLIAPPLEATFALDAALKAADVTWRCGSPHRRRRTSRAATSWASRAPSSRPARRSGTPSSTLRPCRGRCERCPSSTTTT